MPQVYVAYHGPRYDLLVREVVLPKGGVVFRPCPDCACLLSKKQEIGWHQ